MTYKKSKRTLLAILALIMLLSLASCAGRTDERPEIDIGEPPEEMMTPSPEKGWSYDESGLFAYTEYKPEGGRRPYMDMGDGNILVYETGEANELRFGYMDLEFNPLTGPINTMPVPFVNGLCMIVTETGTRVIDSNFNDVPFHFLNYVIDGSDVYGYDYVGSGRFQSWVLADVDPDEFLVPVTSPENPETGETYDMPMTGFMTLSAYLERKPGEKDEFAIEPKYIIAGTFRDGMCPVALKVSESEYRIGFIDEAGNLAIDYIYDGSEGFKEGFATVRVGEDNKESGLEPGEYIIDTENNVIAGPYVICGRFSEGFCPVQETHFEATFVDVNGKTISDARYRHVYAFRDGLARVIKSNGMTYIDTDGREISDIPFKEVLDFSEGRAAVMDMKGQWGFINEYGNWFMEPEFRFASSFHNGFALVGKKLTEPMYLMNEKGEKYLQELNLHQITRFNDDGYAIGMNEQINEDGDMVKRYYLINLLGAAN